MGPKDFPIMLKKIGSWIGSVKRYVRDVQSQVSNLTEETVENEQNKEKTKTEIKKSQNE